MDNFMFTDIIVL